MSTCKPSGIRKVQGLVRGWLARKTLKFMGVLHPLRLRRKLIRRHQMQVRVAKAVRDKETFFV